MYKTWVSRTVQKLGYVLLCCIIVWDQKDEEPINKGITLVDLGVTP